MAVPELHFFAANDVNGATILEVPVTEDYVERIVARPALRELGYMAFRFSRQVGFAIFDSGAFQPETFVRLLVPEVSTTRYLWGCFLNDRVQQLVARVKAGENFDFGGPGPKHYLSRAILWDEQFFGSGYNIDLANGVYRWKETASAGRVLTSLVNDDANNTIAQFLPDLTASFGNSDDSNGDPWTNDIAGTDEFELRIGDDFLTDLFKIEDSGDLETTMNLGTVAAPTLELEAWQAYGRDLSGPIGAATVHFKEAVNILGDLTVAGASQRKASHALVEGLEGAYGHAVRTAWDPGEYAKAVGISHDTTKNENVLDRYGLAWLRRQANNENEILVPHYPGFNQAAGLYFPGEATTNGHYWVGDTVSLTTGGDSGGTWTPLDYRSEDQRVMAITMEMRSVVKDGSSTEAALSWNVIAELNVERGSDAVPEASAGDGANAMGCKCPALCHPATDHFAGLLDASLKASDTGTGLDKFQAVDGDPDTRWSPPNGAGPTANHYWAADLGSAKSAQSMFLRYSDAGAFLDLDIYGSNDAGAWTFLTDGSLVSGDPAANDWTLVKSLVGIPGDPVLETGHFLLDGTHTYRYWLLHAAAGGALSTNEFDIWTVELWEDYFSGAGATAARCEHVHPASDITYDNTGSGMAATNAQTGLDELDARIDALGDSVSASDLLLPHRFLHVAHRGDIGSADSYPEDTLEAAIQAWNKGIPISECDAHLTSDGVWVVMHDPTTTRTTSSSDTISAITAATFVSRVIDGGFGYDAGRHGSSLNPTTLQAFIEAAMQHGGILEIEPKVTADADYLALAEFIVSLNAEHNVRINCLTADDVTIVKGVSQAITTMGVAVTADYVADNTAATVDDVTAYAPQAVAQGMGIADYGNDETTELTLAWDIGVRSFGTNDVDAALVLLHELSGVGGATTAAGISIADAGGYFTGTEVEAALQELGADVAAITGGTHFEPVQFDDGSAEWPFVYFNGEIVMVEVPN